jgi:hypothetical protein
VTSMGSISLASLSGKEFHSPPDMRIS